jgi:hypothetical protein
MLNDFSLDAVILLSHNYIPGKFRAGVLFLCIPYSLKKLIKLRSPP